MKKINENTKVTLTFKQLKNLIKEGSNNRPDDEYPLAGKEYSGKGYGVGWLSKAKDFLEKYERVFLVSFGDSIQIFGANSYEDLCEVSKKSGWWDIEGEADILDAIWDLDVDEVYNPISHGSATFAEHFSWFCIK